MPLARTLLIRLSRSPFLRQLSENNALARKVSRRFVAGLSSQDALHVIADLNQTGISATLDSLGENVRSFEEAERAGNVYLCLLQAIEQDKLNANVSLKLTQMGMDLSPQRTEQLVEKLVERADSTNSFVRIDMEDSSYTEATIALTERLNERFPNGTVGTVIQAYLFRSEKDVDRLLSQKIRIRLCKGAYKESGDVAFPKKSDVDENYFRLAVRLITSGTFHGLATHDETLIQRITDFAVANGVSPESFEFQMLYGVRRDLQRKLIKLGFQVRVYVPFGDEWYPYFMRRLAERPANLLFIAKNLLRS